MGFLQENVPTHYISLNLEELRHAVSVTPGETTWDSRKLVNDIQKVVNACGSFLIVDEEDYTVQFAHHSVKQHLTSLLTHSDTWPSKVQGSSEDISLGEICVTYLSLNVFQQQLAKIPNPARLQSSQLPSAIITSAIPQPILSKVAALSLLKSRRTHKYDLHDQLKATILPSQSPQGGQTYLFLAYAREFWLFHTRNFSPDRAVTYTLWTT